MNFLWILLGITPGVLLYLIYLLKKKQDKKAKLFKDFWACSISWTAAGLVTFIYSVFSSSYSDAMLIFLPIGIISNVISTILIMEKDKNNQKTKKK